MKQLISVINSNLYDVGLVLVFNLSPIAHQSPLLSLSLSPSLGHSPVMEHVSQQIIEISKWLPAMMA